MRNFFCIGLLLFFSANSFALEALKEAEDHRQVDAAVLSKAARSNFWWRRLRAAEAYGRIQKPAAIEILLPMLRDRSPQVVSAAAFALGQFAWQADFADGKEAKIVEALVPLLSSRSKSVRLFAVEAIGKLGFSETAVLLQSAFRDHSARVRADRADASKLSEQQFF